MVGSILDCKNRGDLIEQLKRISRDEDIVEEGYGSMLKVLMYTIAYKADSDNDQYIKPDVEDVYKVLIAFSKLVDFDIYVEGTPGKILIKYFIQDVYLDYVLRAFKDIKPAHVLQLIEDIILSNAGKKYCSDLTD